MSTSGKLDILLHGLGAIGSFYAFILQRSPRVRLSVVTRSNYEAVKANGVTIRSANHGSHTFKPFQVLRTPGDATQKFDYVVCANKAIGVEAICQALMPVVREGETAFALMQNGVGIEEEFQRVWPSCTVLSGVVWVGATQKEPGVVDHGKSEDTELGLFDNGHIPKDTQQQRLDELVSIFREGGTNITVPSNIATARWKKLIWNIAWNSLTALTEVDTATWFSSSELATPLTKRLMQESITVAKAKGVEGIEDSLANELIDKIISLGGIYSSMYQDRKEGRPMEVEPILGAPVRWGRELGVSIPTMEILYALLKAVGKGQEMGRQ